MMILKKASFREVPRDFGRYALFIDFTLGCPHAPCRGEKSFSLLIGHRLPQNHRIILKSPLIWAVQERPQGTCPQCGFTIILFNYLLPALSAVAFAPRDLSAPE